MKFVEFVDHKQREAKRHLSIIKKLLESQGFKVHNYLEGEEPYIFMDSPEKNKVSFDGIRIYNIGTALCYRIQKEKTTHPFGKSYSLNIEEMFDDLLSDHRHPEAAGKEVVKAVTEEVKKFFSKTAEAEKELRSGEFDRADPLNRVMIKTTGTDYSSTIFSKSS